MVKSTKTLQTSPIVAVVCSFLLSAKLKEICPLSCKLPSLSIKAHPFYYRASSNYYSSKKRAGKFRHS